MKAHWTKRWWSVVALLVLSVAVSGCMTERSPIDTSDPLALDKRLFEGEFFYKQTIVDIPYSVDYAFIGETNDLKIIRWEVTENWLIGYNTKEKKETTDTNGNLVQAKTPVVAYPIRKHFDIMLAQNSMTGEDLPMVVENYDKPWWQRRYFTIDPSSSGVTNFELKYLNLTIDWDRPFYKEPVAGYYNMEFHDKAGKAISPKDYELRHMAGGDQLVDTFSFHTDMIVSPNNDYRGIYTWADLEERINWEPARIKMRHFFWSVDREAIANNGFKTMEFQDEMFRRFGFFVRTYRGVDPEYGYRENYHHEWANYYNIEGDNKIVYYINGEFPEHMVLAACSIASDYNWAFTKAYYEGTQAREIFDSTGRGFVSDFPEMSKLADGLYQTGLEGSVLDSALMPDATEEWPADYDLVAASDQVYAESEGKYRKYYYIDYNIEGYIPPAEWDTGSEDDTRIQEFQDKQQQMIQAYLDYCFTEHPSDKFVLRRPTMMEYDYDRDGVNPEGMPNLITPAEIKAIYGENVDSRMARPVDYPVACKLTLERRCEIDSNGNKVARFEQELGDPRYSFIYWVPTPTEYGILGVAQWSDNPETGQIFGGVGHIAGSVLQWSVAREIERYYMLDKLKAVGFNPTSEYYDQLLHDIVIDADYTRRPEQGETDSRPTDKVNPPPPQIAENALLTALLEPGPALTVGSEAWKMSAVNHMPQFVDMTRAEALAMSDTRRESTHEELRLLKEKHLPKLANNLDLNRIKGTPWETRMASSAMLDFLYPGSTSFNEEMLYQISPLYYGTHEAMMRLKDREVAFTTGCYYQAEWLDGGFLEIIQRLDRAGYNREQIRRFIERVMFKGVAQHEVGHAIGLRHNFMASADEMNYVGSKTHKTGYWAFKDKAQQALDQKVQQFFDDNGRMPTPIEKFYLEKTIPTPRDWYMYSSVMDYMDEFYYHGFGLGGYDVSALRYVYGKAIEKYKTDSQNQVEYTPGGDPKVVIEPLFEYRYCTANDIYNATCACVPGIPRDGARDEDCVCTEAKGMPYCYNAAQPVEALRYEPKVVAVTDAKTGRMEMVPVDGERVGIQLNGNNKPYLYCPDNWRFEHPMCNVWDRGYTARDIVRNMAEQYKRFYFYRFFRRGNPMFQRTHFFGSVFRLFPMVHFALDFNYNRFQIAEWQQLLLDRSENPFPADGNIALPRKEYILAVNGVEEWTETINGQTVKKSLTPGGPGDYLIAAMEGLNFLVYDVMYTPDVGKHVLSSWKEDGSKNYFLKNPYIYDERDLEDTLGGAIVNVDLTYGRHHKNHWDFQDDMGITQPKLERRGFSVEKDASSFLIANSGWWVWKYAYESMANAFSYISDGFDAAIFQVMANVVNEDSMMHFSRYCVEETGRNQFKVRVYQPRVNDLYLYNWTEDWDETGAWYPHPTDPSKSLCQKASADYGKPLVPLHASWVYFDKMEPVLWNIYNQANIMANNSVYLYYYSFKIPVGERDQWDDVDGVTSVECINPKETHYYRAYKFPADPRPSPIFDVVQRCAAIQSMCVIDQAKGQAPGNLSENCQGWPRWYLNRDLDHMEASFMLMNSFSDFWTDTAKLFFW